MKRKREQVVVEECCGSVVGVVLFLRSFADRGCMCQGELECGLLLFSFGYVNRLESKVQSTVRLCSCVDLMVLVRKCALACMLWRCWK